MCLSLYRPSLIDVEEEVVCVVDSIVRSEEDGGKGKGKRKREKGKTRKGRSKKGIVGPLIVEKLIQGEAQGDMLKVWTSALYGHFRMLQTWELTRDQRGRP